MQKSNKRSDFLPLEVERLVSVIDFLDFLIEGSHFLPPDSRVVVHKNHANMSQEIYTFRSLQFWYFFFVFF